MSGTSLDGIDVAAIATDGRRRVIPGPALTVPYPAGFRERLRSVLGGIGLPTEIEAVEAELTRLHAAAIAQFRAQHPDVAVELVGFHGHTILHRPAARRTWQIGDGALLARLAGVDVVADFRSADVAAGGEGAPLAPLYHAALAADLPKPLAVLNLGGVGNVTWIGPGTNSPGTNDGPDEILAFDTGPGNALIDDWVRSHTGQSADLDGALAHAGRVSTAHVTRFLGNPYFDRPPPKSLDRDDFRGAVPGDLALADGAATLTEMTAAAVAASARHFPSPPCEWLVCGGGRHNPAIMTALQRLLGVTVRPGPHPDPPPPPPLPPPASGGGKGGGKAGEGREGAPAVPVRPVEAVGWSGDALEAQAFAYLAVRSVFGLPLSLPSTTGAPRPVCGGRLFEAAR
jgi:anhydro-N-acetylmuramic acid kinase